MKDKNVLLMVLRVIATSYRERIDRPDTKPYEFAQDALAYLGVDLETIPPDQEVLDYLDFMHWRKERKARP